MLKQYLAIVLYLSGKIANLGRNIDTATWPVGLYVLRLDNGSQWPTKKVLKVAP